MDSRSLVQLDVAVPDIFRIESSDILDAEHAKILGLLTVLPQEIPNLQIRLIEGKPGDRFFQQIANEMRSPYRWDHKIVAYRSTRRWVRTYDPVPLSSNHPEVLQEGAVYAVVGDLLDGLGMIYACALREGYAAKVILIGRKGLPSPNEWDTWLATHGNQHPVSQLIQRMKALGREGVDFVMTSVDLGDAKAMSEAFKESMARRQFAIAGSFLCGCHGGRGQLRIGGSEKGRYSKNTRPQGAYDQCIEWNHCGASTKVYTLPILTFFGVGRSRIRSLCAANLRIWISGSIVLKRPMCNVSIGMPVPWMNKNRPPPRN